MKISAYYRRRTKYRNVTFFQYGTALFPTITNCVNLRSVTVCSFVRQNTGLVLQKKRDKKRDTAKMTAVYDSVVFIISKQG